MYKVIHKSRMCLGQCFKRPTLQKTSTNIFLELRPGFLEYGEREMEKRLYISSMLYLYVISADYTMT